MKYILIAESDLKDAFDCAFPVGMERGFEVVQEQADKMGYVVDAESLKDAVIELDRRIR